MASSDLSRSFPSLSIACSIWHGVASARRGPKSNVMLCYEGKKGRKASLLFSCPPSPHVGGPSAFLGVLVTTDEQRIEIPGPFRVQTWMAPITPPLYDLNLKVASQSVRC